MEEELKVERKDKKRQLDEIESLKRELQKANFAPFTTMSGPLTT